MTRTSDNYYIDGRLQDGYDYENQAWVRNGVYVRCGHADSVNCRCFGKLHEGEQARKRSNMEGRSLESSSLCPRLD